LKARFVFIKPNKFLKLQNSRQYAMKFTGFRTARDRYIFFSVAGRFLCAQSI
jgi:hypothetical protein